MPRELPVIWRPKTCFTCCTVWASRQALTLTRWLRLRALLLRCWGTFQPVSITRQHQHNGGVGTGLCTVTHYCGHYAYGGGPGTRKGALIPHRRVLRRVVSPDA